MARFSEVHSMPRRLCPALLSSTIAVVLVACGSAAPARTASLSPTPSLHPTAADATASPAMVRQLESCGQLTRYADGNFGPVACSDGKPSMQAALYVNRLGWSRSSQLLSLGSAATSDDVTRAICYDYKHLTGTIPITQSLAELAAAEYSWQFGVGIADLVRQAIATC